MQYLSSCTVAFFALAAATLTNPAMAAGHAHQNISTDSSYIITGQIAGLHGGKAYIMHAEKPLFPLDSTVIDSEGRFRFSGKVGSPEWCGFGVNIVSQRNQNPAFFFLERGSMTITGKQDSIAKVVFGGTPLQHEMADYDANEALYLNWDWNWYWSAQTDASGKKDKPRLDSLQQRYDEMMKNIRRFAAQYATAHPHSYVAAFNLNRRYSYNPDISELEQVFDGMDATIRSSYFGKHINDMLAEGKRTGIGRPAPDFTQNDVNGKSVSLSSYRGKYLLIDFWASWCGPCRAENPTVVEAYRKFHDKGFEILSISLDDNKDKWLEAVKNDNLEWKQVSDLKGGNNSVARLYGVDMIPMNYLLDKNGKIVAKGLRGEQLENKLAELVH